MVSETINNEQIALLLNDVLEVYGYDFLEYSSASIKRRITRLYSLDNFVSFAEFRYTVRSDKQYFKRFLEEITVNVTEMFRDPTFYKTLRNEVLPILGTYPLIRVWIAGCSTGEEAFSLAILLKELNLLNKSLIYATDINPSVLEKAKKGIFPLNYIKQYSENYNQTGGTEDFSKYYIANYAMAKFDENLRSKMIFSTHNLVSDHSFNEFQLILCRNVLIYFDKELQHKVFNLFDNSLEKLGYIALGSKESLDFWPNVKQYKRIRTEKIWRKT
ncbi:CheR family methyltransferase [Pedobacter sp. MW01-1-1]|uniref:CheR family methyltransferase n=1 Tax=Pedobacter sp. MW01-1-1 TaxID=3383027 RepID=UPI003FF01D71